MRESHPSISDWRELYSAAAEFKKTACWEWMLDSDLFGVQDPVAGEIGYCCIMGNMGEFFALGVYLGAEGLEIYMRIQNGEIAQDDPEMLTAQKCLMASFEDREYITKEDMEIIKKLNLRFRGRNQWPLFRVYEPGYHPWYLNRDQVKYLTLALQQAVEVALRFAKYPDMLIPPKRNHFLVRVPKKSSSGLVWEDEWLKPEPLKRQDVAVPPINEIRLQKIRNAIRSRGGTWEADFFISPTPVGKMKEERPYYPYAILYVDSHSELVLKVDIVRPPDHFTRFPNSLMDIMENAGIVPRELLVKRQEAFDLLKLMASRLDIRLKLVHSLEALEEAQDSMLQYLR